MSQNEGTIDYRVVEFGICRPSNRNEPSSVSFEATLQPLSGNKFVKKKLIKLILTLDDIKTIGVDSHTYERINALVNKGGASSDWWREMLLLNNEINKRIFNHTVRMRFD
jgi:hypothetical protein